MMLILWKKIFAHRRGSKSHSFVVVREVRCFALVAVRWRRWKTVDGRTFKQTLLVLRWSGTTATAIHPLARSAVPQKNYKRAAAATSFTTAPANVRNRTGRSTRKCAWHHPRRPEKKKKNRVMICRSVQKQHHIARLTSSTPRNAKPR